MSNEPHSRARPRHLSGVRGTTRRGNPGPTLDAGDKAVMFWSVRG